MLRGFLIQRTEEPPFHGVFEEIRDKAGDKQIEQCSQVWSGSIEYK